MPAKGTKSTKTTKPKVTRSNVAKSSSKTGLLSKKIKFNWKIAAVVGVILVAALGYLFVRLSSASGGIRYYDASKWSTSGSGLAGEPITKNDGSRAIGSVVSGSEDIVRAAINITGSYYSSTEYCLELATSGNTEVSAFTFVNDTTKLSLYEKNVPASNGKIKKCFWLDSRAAAASKKITFQARSAAGQKFYFYGLTEKAQYVVQGEKNAQNNPPATTQSPAPQLNCATMVNGQGNQNGCVTLIQQRLKDLGYDPGPVDGIYGSKTASAVKLFQSRSGLTQDGVVGPQTWNALTSSNAARKQ
jgi:hypothetical protein